MSMGLLLVGSLGGIAAATIGLFNGLGFLAAILLYFGVGNGIVFATIGLCALRTVAARTAKPTPDTASEGQTTGI